MREAGDLGYRCTQRADDGRKDLARRVFAAAFEFRQVLRRNAGAGGGIGQSVSAGMSVCAQSSANHLAPQRLHRACCSTLIDSNDLAHDRTLACCSTG